MLKPLGRLTDPDIRQTSFVRLDLATSTFAPITLANYHAAVDALALGPSVPEDIVMLFDMSRNAFLFGWFEYELTMLAALQAYATLEAALKAKAEREGAEALRDLGPNLKRAIAVGWLRDEGLPVAQKVREARASIPRPPHQVSAASEETELPYVEVLRDTLPKLRNALAHGERHLLPPGYALSTIEICRDLINQLFAAPAVADAQSASS